MDTLTLIDVSGFIYRNHFGNPAMLTSDGRPCQAVHGCSLALWRLLRSQPTYIAAVTDVSRRSFRHDLYPEYKAQRPPMPDDLRVQLPLVRQAIDAFGVTVVEAENYEADDVIATLTDFATMIGLSVSIVSSDKDLMQLIRGFDNQPNVRLIDPVNQQVIGHDQVIAKWGVDPEQMCDFLALMGDAADNVPGVPGIGKKTAAKLLTTFGTLDAVLAAANANDERLTGKIAGNLVEYTADARISRALVELKRDAPIAFDLETMRLQSPDPATVAAFLDSCDLVTAKDEIFRKAAA